MLVKANLVPDIPVQIILYRYTATVVGEHPNSVRHKGWLIGKN